MIMRLIYFIIILCLCFSSCKKTEKQTHAGLKTETIEAILQKKIKDSSIVSKITFPSRDGLPITADIYKVNNNPITILLCHQAGYSRGEYKDTALILNKLGYSVMAIDQRSGNAANNVVNETAQAAKAKGLPTTYLDARQDIEAAIDYIYSMNSNKPIILVGSSYSASLALLIGESNTKIKAVAAFSPGEYFKGINISETIKPYSKPIFVTASYKETPKLITLVSLVNPKFVKHYKPKEKGIHGSRALWSTTEGVTGYWDAFKAFLKDI